MCLQAATRADTHFAKAATTTIDDQKEFDALLVCARRKTRGCDWSRKWWKVMVEGDDVDC